FSIPSTPRPHRRMPSKPSPPSTSPSKPCTPANTPPLSSPAPSMRLHRRRRVPQLLLRRLHRRIILHPLRNEALQCRLRLDPPIRRRRQLRAARRCRLAHLVQRGLRFI